MGHLHPWPRKFGGTMNPPGQAENTVTTTISWQMEPAMTRTMVDPHRSWPRLEIRWQISLVWKTHDRGCPPRSLSRSCPRSGSPVGYEIGLVDGQRTARNGRDLRSQQTSSQP